MICKKFLRERLSFNIYCRHSLKHFLEVLQNLAVTNAKILPSPQKLWYNVKPALKLRCELQQKFICVNNIFPFYTVSCLSMYIVERWQDKFCFYLFFFSFRSGLMRLKRCDLVSFWYNENWKSFRYFGTILKTNLELGRSRWDSLLSSSFEMASQQRGEIVWGCFITFVFVELS
jgi:hypothetical protein